ncbi:uncharacterized protein N7500_009707 [Penicillium coprophilum]|uniref:uncharacterized protein n=1 Tax=Penicillium coprophilum TaxID=36646 RepID=UPI0023972238|nr:uncharacterized protein N7500_009707 [Penicillium coprophilum]KAJ5154268.1 hypothetical protein N7500_009707 [Penicillium coprophilum]
MESPNSLPAYNELYRQPPRPMSRSAVSRSGSRRVSPSALTKHYSGDSSDEEVPEPKFSASVKALLHGDGLGSSPHLQKAHISHEPRIGISRQQSRSPRNPSPHDSSNGSPAPRIVRIGAISSGSRFSREGSPLSNSQSAEPEQHSRPNDFITPAPRQRSVRINASRSNTQSPASASPSGNRSSERNSGDEYGSADRSDSDRKSLYDDDLALRYGPSSALRGRGGEEIAPHSSLRVKRVGRLAGTFLNGPARRGVLRRQSEESNEENHQYGSADGVPEDVEGEEEHAEYRPHKPSSPKVSWADPSPPLARDSNRREYPLRPAEVEGPFSRSSSPKSHASKSTPASSDMSSKSSIVKEQPVFKVPSIPALPSVRDQENEPPPTFRRTKPQRLNVLDKPEKYNVVYDSEKKDVAETPATNSARKILATRSNNTPHRAAPPPPKMSVLETATSTGGRLDLTIPKEEESSINQRQAFHSA